MNNTSKTDPYTRFVFSCKTHPIARVFLPCFGNWYFIKFDPRLKSESLGLSSDLKKKKKKKKNTQGLSIKMPAVLQIALFKILRCAVGVHFVSIVFYFTKFRCTENRTPQDNFRYVMVCFRTCTPQKTRPEKPELKPV